MARRDPDAWRNRAKKEPARRWFLKAFGWTVVGLSNLGGAIGFLERFWSWRLGPAPIVVTPGPVTVTASVVAPTVQVFVADQLAIGESVVVRLSADGAPAGG